MKLTIREVDKKIMLPAGTDLFDGDNLKQVIDYHRRVIAPKYHALKDMYTGDYDILHKPKKAEYKPDNRLVANHAKYLVDTFVGFFVGIPPKITHENAEISRYLTRFAIYSGLEDVIAEIAKQCDEYGVAPLLLYMDEEAMPCIAKTPPTESFVVYDDSILHRPMYGIRYYKNNRNRIEGTISDAEVVCAFNDNYRIVEENPHPFGGVPIVEFMENEERIGLIESVETLLDGYNKIISEKANDVDYYADAYLKILGKKLDTNTIKELRDNRIINMAGSGTDKLIVEFLQKPDADATAEHLLDRMEKLIFNLSMVANISEESFGNASGTALAYRLQPMSNLAKTKARKFTASLQQIFRMLSSVPTARIGADDWIGIDIVFTNNVPKNLLEESQIAQNLQGLVSDETILRVLSIVQDVKTEMEKLQEQREAEEPDERFVRDEE